MPGRRVDRRRCKILSRALAASSIRRRRRTRNLPLNRRLHAVGAAHVAPNLIAPCQPGASAVPMPRPTPTDVAHRVRGRGVPWQPPDRARRQPVSATRPAVARRAAPVVPVAARWHAVPPVPAPSHASHSEAARAAPVHVVPPALPDCRAVPARGRAPERHRCRVPERAAPPAARP